MRALIFDTETTGLVENRSTALDKQPYIIEFYAVDCDLKTGEIYEEVGLLIKPPIKISEEITKITTITNEMLVDCLSFEDYDISEKIIKTIESSKLVIAHNISFDCDMIELECERVSRCVNWPRKLCTVEQTVGLVGVRLTLSKLHEYLFNEPFNGAHRAKVDVMALKRCCEELYKRDVI